MTRTILDSNQEREAFLTVVCDFKQERLTPSTTAWFTSGRRRCWQKRRILSSLMTSCNKPDFNTRWNWQAYCNLLTSCHKSVKLQQVYGVFTCDLFCSRKLDLQNDSIFSLRWPTGVYTSSRTDCWIRKHLPICLHLEAWYLQHSLASCAYHCQWMRNCKTLRRF